MRSGVEYKSKQPITNITGWCVALQSSMRIIVLFIAIALAATAMFFAYNMFNKKDDQQVLVDPKVQEQSYESADIYVARQPIQVGEVIEMEKLDRKPVPTNIMLPGFRAGG